MARKTRTRRLCSVCHLPGHTKRSHRRNPVRRNLDAFTDRHGIHPIRSSKDYDESRVTKASRIANALIRGKSPKGYNIRSLEIAQMVENIRSGQLRLQSKRDSLGRKISASELAAVERSVKSGKRRLVSAIKAESQRKKLHQSS